MNWSDYSTRVPAKWILAGEHAVLRGATAVAIPQTSMSLNLKFEANSGEPAIQVSPPESQQVIEELLHAIEDAWTGEGRSFVMPQGKLTIDSNIPIGAGLGSSAALCVAMSRWLAGPLNLQDNKAVVDFAVQLEHRFHGRSSGVDVAVISAGEPITYVKGRGIKSMGIKSLPKFTFHDTGLRSRTSECIYRVDKLREEAPALAIHVDEEMSTASRLAMEGLILYNSASADSKAEGLTLIQKGMQQARECFYSWELVPGQAKRLEEELLSQGAKAVKLTGAGGGGMVVALWE